MENFIKFNNSNNSHTFLLNPERPFFKITKIEIPSIPKGTPNIMDLAPKFTLTWKLNVIDKSVITNQINGIAQFLEPNTKEAKFQVNKVIGFDSTHVSVELHYSNPGQMDENVFVYYTQFDKTVDIKNPFESFGSHIDLMDNAKILFSAPYGQGKSIFLNYFFEEHSSLYEVFKVFPVNYAISHNEDVFKYIKTEILFQLLSKNVEFDKESFSYFQTAPEFFKNDPIKILSPLIKLIPKFGKSAYDIFVQLYKLANEYFDYHDKAQVNEKEKAEKFIKELYEKEGSIFEDNFYTQLIRQQLEKLKLASAKRNVLIIEDLDRMDPDHIFRILNVFAAHFDTQEFASGYSNKFGFDKIIIVGDYNNIRQVFAYRYGPEVHFEGYINKYYSREPFFYDNKEAIAQLIRNLKIGFPPNQIHVGVNLFSCVLSDLVATENLTLRDLIKLSKNNVIDIVHGQLQRSSKRPKSFYYKFVHFNLLYYLSKIFSIDSLIQKFETCKNNINSRTNWDYNKYAYLGLPSLVVEEEIGTKPYEFTYNSSEIKFRVNHNYYPDFDNDYFDVIEVKCSPRILEEETKFIFNKMDFYEVLILNAKKYKEVGGFES